MVDCINKNTFKKRDGYCSSYSPQKIRLPNRGSAFKSLIESCNISKKPDRVLAAIHYLKMKVLMMPPRVIMICF